MPQDPVNNKRPFICCENDS